MRREGGITPNCCRQKRPRCPDGVSGTIWICKRVDPGAEGRIREPVFRVRQMALPMKNLSAGLVERNLASAKWAESQLLSQREVLARRKGRGISPSRRAIPRKRRFFPSFVQQLSMS